MWEKRPTNTLGDLRSAHASYATYSYGKRGLLMGQKRPTYGAKEAYTDTKHATKHAI